MAYKISKKSKKNKKTFKVKRKKYNDMEEVDEIYDMGEDIAQRSNPFFMAGRSLGYDDDNQKKIYKKIK
jgi:hypothetical protein